MGTSTSRDSLIGLPLSMDSNTANSRDRSASSRAIRNRYLPRSAPDIRDHGPKAFRAAATAASTSASDASLTSANTSSVAGLTVLKPLPRPSTKSPPMNSP